MLNVASLFFFVLGGLTFTFKEDLRGLRGLGGLEGLTDPSVSSLGV